MRYYVRFAYIRLQQNKGIGIDLDVSSLELAQENANKHYLAHVNLWQQDAWNLDLH
ncbi:hypothetical protein A1C_01830 [Rickettsia akari str. Hartford]|uniref:Uncharacterized protein n=1 Tax=Rickettsia akari (strain Hartford) TaxID=293614 RepID=A8GMQ2_RICAH|nr:hypothetical protein A1C_01830 [Rickettsia akari str. Hartford]